MMHVSTLFLVTQRMLQIKLHSLKVHLKRTFEMLLVMTGRNHQLRSGPKLMLIKLASQWFMTVINLALILYASLETVLGDFEVSYADVIH